MHTANRAPSDLTRRMEQGSILPLVIRLTLPAVAAQLITFLYNIVDRMYVARIPDAGMDALAALGIVLPITLMIQAFANLTGLLAERGEAYRCGENGVGLSGGEKQRISIARTLLKKSSVLLADEATAALDAKTAHAVTSDLLDLTGMTRIIVTHNLEASALRRFDRILVMKDGCIEETGTFDELMAGKGYFYALFTVSQ